MFNLPVALLLFAAVQPNESSESTVQRVPVSILDIEVAAARTHLMKLTDSAYRFTVAYKEIVFDYQINLLGRIDSTGSSRYDFAIPFVPCDQDSTSRVSGRQGQPKVQEHHESCFWSYELSADYAGCGVNVG